MNGDANKHVVQGRLVLYGANWVSGTPGSGDARLIKIWDSYEWGVYYLTAKFNAAPTVANGKAFLPSYDGTVKVLG